MLLAGDATVGEATTVEKVEEATVVEVADEEIVVVIAVVNEELDDVVVNEELEVVFEVELDETVAGPSANTPPDAEGEVLAELAPSANIPALVVTAAGATTAVTVPGAEVSPRSL